MAEAQAFFALAQSLHDGGRAVSFFVPGEAPNARGAEALGLLPRAGGLDTRGILEAARDGKLGALAIFGANPVLHYPDRALVEAALDATPFVVVSELFMTETAQRATLVLPAASAYEKSGTTTDVAGDILPVAGSVVAPGEVQADGDMFVLLAQALGVALPEPDDLTHAAATAKAPSERPLPAPSAAPAVGAGELRLIVESAIFSGGGTSAFDARSAGLRARPQAVLHPQTAAGLGLCDGELVDAAAGSGTVHGLTVRLTPRVPAGAVAILDGLPEAAANVLGAGAAVTLRTARTAVTAGGA